MWSDFLAEQFPVVMLSKKAFSPERTKACPELAVALSVVEGVAEWVEGEASGHRIGFLPRCECEILRGFYP